MTSDVTEVLWLTPDKPENISVGRERIASHLEDGAFDVTLRGTNLRTALRSLRDGRNYDVVIGTTRSGAILGTVLHLLWGVPLVVDHVDPIRQFAENAPRPATWVVRLLERLSFTAADHVLYVYDEESDRVERYASSWSRTDLGVDYERFAHPGSEVLERGRETIGEVAEGDRVAIYVGGLEPIYHVDELLQAIETLDGWSIVLVGDGSLAEHVADVASERVDVVFLGTVPHEDVPGLLHAADVGVALVDDPNTLKVLEYGASGLPVVHLSGRAEERLEGLVEFCDATPESIAEAVERARGTGSTLASVAEQHDWRDIADDYRRAVTSVI